jgi:thiol-disulfide isomerase/thioredoxin
MPREKSGHWVFAIQGRRKKVRGINKKVLVFSVFFLAIVVQVRLYANDYEPSVKELSTLDVTFYTEKVQLPLEGLLTLEGLLYSSEALRGKFVLVNLWASWCQDCRREKPSIERLYREINNSHLFGKDEFTLLTVSLGEEPYTVKSYMTENQYSFPVVLDRENKLPREYASWIPTSYILGPDGNIIARMNWEKEWDSEQALRTLKRLVSIISAQQ